MALNIKFWQEFCGTGFSVNGLRPTKDKFFYLTKMEHPDVKTFSH